MGTRQDPRETTPASRGRSTPHCLTVDHTQQCRYQRSALCGRSCRRQRPCCVHLRLLPLTYFVIFVGGAITLLTVTADIVNPIRLGQ
ncbi:hypothetical protein FKR81_43000 [Lentzea tibetensis]|uniref:Uncharacterized protein n=1 Tax=Lentzea tibetensis TaxID=2591470 RepID=A0A563EEF2_9PSEU|nr:hypothetical protein FKR81_43000 [Lentzea tibetensis]